MALFSSNKASVQPREPLDRRRSLAGIPVLNENVDIDKTSDKKWVLTMTLKRKKTNGFLSRFTPNNPVHRFELDELGTFVVRHLDGRTTAGQIIDRFVERFKVNRREAELSVVEFLKTLSRKRIISIAVQ